MQFGLKHGKYIFILSYATTIDIMRLKSQSAMEYLMTYGWAVLIIAVVIAVLFDLGIFSAPNITTTCVAQSGFLCASPLITNTGATYVQFAQNTGSPLEITGFGCSNSSSAPQGFNLSFVILQPGQQIDAMFPCQIESGTIGTRFTGTLWVRYNTQLAKNLIEQIGSISGAVSVAQKIYIVSGGGTGSFQVFSTLTRTVIKTGHLGNFANYLEYNPNADLIYSSSEGNLFIINDANYAVNTIYINSGSIEQIGLSSSGTVFLATYNPDYAYVLTSSGQIVANIPIDGIPTATNVSSDGYGFIGTSTGSLYIISQSGSLVANMPIGQITNLVPSAGGNIYVGTSTNGIYEISSDGTIMANVLLDGPVEAIAASPSGGVYVGTLNPSYIYQIGSGGSIISNVPVNDYMRPTAAISPDGGAVYMLGDTHLYILSGSKLSMVSFPTYLDNYVYVSMGGTVYVPISYSPLLYAVNPNTANVIAGVPIYYGTNEYTIDNYMAQNPAGGVYIATCYGPYCNDPGSMYLVNDKGAIVYNVSLSLGQEEQMLAVK